MALVDRTDELLRLVEAQAKAGVEPRPPGAAVSGERGQRKTASSTAEAREFGEKASQISRKIQLTSGRLQRLAELTRSKGTFDDPMAEINTLAARLKNDTKFLKIELDQLQSYLNRNKSRVGNGSVNAAEHSQTVVEAMKFQLHSTAQGFKSVLEERQSTMKEKSDRRGLFGSQRAPLGSSTTGLNARLRDGNDINGNSFEPHTNGTNTAPEGEEEDESVSMDVTPLIQQSATVQDESYLTSRAEAMTTIESHIMELGEVFSQLSQMVTEHGQLVNRIDDNVRDAQENWNLGHQQLIRTWQNVSNNRWLAAKVAFILMFFMTFFVVFLA